MYCPECGKVISDDSKFCQHCGFKISHISESQPQIKVQYAENKQEIKKEQPKKSVKLIVLFVLICICAVLIIAYMSVTLSSKETTNAVPEALSTPTPSPINSVFQGKWRDQIYNEGDEWIQYELTVNIWSKSLSVDSITKAGKVSSFGPVKIEAYGEDYISASGYVFKYNKNNDTLDVNGSQFTPPFTRYIEQQSTPMPSSTYTLPPKKSSFTNVEAFTVAEYIVKQELIAPSTAKLCKITDATCTYNESTDRWIVKGWVNSQNSYGAMIKQNFTAEFQPVRDNKGNIGCKHGSVKFY